MPRKTDSNNPADWLWIAALDMELIRLAAERELGHAAARSKLAEVLEKIMKAELLRLGWRLVKTHDLRFLHRAIGERNSELAAQAEPLCIELAEVYFTDRYPGFDFSDPDWPAFRAQVAAVDVLFDEVKKRVEAPSDGTG